MAVGGWVIAYLGFRFNVFLSRDVVNLMRGMTNPESGLTDTHMKIQGLNLMTLLLLQILVLPPVLSGIDHDSLSNHKGQQAHHLLFKQAGKCIIYFEGIFTNIMKS